jgi:hypothetical protein
VQRDSAIAKAERNEAENASDSTSNEKKGFFKRIFGGKDKTERDKNEQPEEANAQEAVKED